MIWPANALPSSCVDHPEEVSIMCKRLVSTALVGLVALALFVYRGNQWTIALAALAWLVTIGWLLTATFPANLQYAPAYLPFLLPVYVEFVLLWKAERVALARAEHEWNRHTAHDARP